LLRLDAVWVWEPVREVALEAVQVRSGGAVADVAVGSGKVVRRLSHTQPRERLPADVCRALGAASRVRCCTAVARGRR
jgi:ubiquinone/menaquinone biosynthesis C-methylase UbiE